MCDDYACMYGDVVDDAVMYDDGHTKGDKDYRSLSLTPLSTEK